MNTSSLSSYSREQLSDILRILKLYKISLVQIGHRAQLIDPKENQEIVIRVEYPATAKKEEILPLVYDTLKQVFSLENPSSDIVFLENAHLVGGMRVFVGDDMADVSFKKFENALKVV